MCLWGYAGKNVYNADKLVPYSVVMPLELIGAMWWPTVGQGHPLTISAFCKDCLGFFFFYCNPKALPEVPVLTNPVFSQKKKSGMGLVPILEIVHNRDQSQAQRKVPHGTSPIKNKKVQLGSVPNA